jgi:hypothetical protein
LHGQDDPVVVTAVKPKGSAGDDEDGVDGKMVSSDEGDDSSEKSTDSDGGSSS